MTFVDELSAVYNEEETELDAVQCWILVTTTMRYRPDGEREDKE